MKWYSRIASLIMALVTVVGMFSITSSNIYASSIVKNAAEESSTETNLDIFSLANELSFYFEKAGTIQEDGSYVVTNIELIQRRAENGDVYANKFLEQYMSSKNGYRSMGSYAKCVLIGISPVGYLNDVIAALEAFTGKGFGEAIKSLGSWKTAQIIAKTLGKVGLDASVAGIAAQLAISLATCVGS